MTGEWPDTSELNTARDVLFDAGLNTDALAIFLIPEFEARFAILNTELGFMRQLFRNKHGVPPTAQAETVLFNSLTGGNFEFNGNTIPGYGGNTVAFATQFALDNSLSGFTGVDGLPLTSLHLYSKPNSPEEDTLLVTLITTLLGASPTDPEIAALSGKSLEAAAEQVLRDPRYFGQFPSEDPESAFAQTMAGFGVFDINLNGPEDDADGDGFTNAEEVDAGSNPNDANDTPGSPDAVYPGGAFLCRCKWLKLETGLSCPECVERRPPDHTAQFTGESEAGWCFSPRENLSAGPYIE